MFWSNPFFKPFFINYYWTLNYRPSSFAKASPNITHNATWSPSDITEGKLSNYTQPQKALNYFYSTVYVVRSTPKTCKDTLIGKIGGVTL